MRLAYNSTMKKKKNALVTDEGYIALLDDLAKTRDELQNTYNTLENVVDPDLIDACIYQVNAVQLRYKFLLNCVKKLEDSYAKNPLS